LLVSGYGVSEDMDVLLAEFDSSFQPERCFMEIEIDEEKVDEAVLALLYLTTFTDKLCCRAWKSRNWDSLDRLHEKGYISDPATKAKSVVLTEEGAKRSQDLFEKYFTKAA